MTTETDSDTMLMEHFAAAENGLADMPVSVRQEISDAVNGLARLRAEVAADSAREDDQRRKNLEEFKEPKP